jgi:iron complex outermembrane receptor protein
MRILFIALGLLVGAPLLPLHAYALSASQTYQLDIPRQTLDSALKDLATQTGFEVARLNDSESGDPIVGPVRGKVSIIEALKTLLAPEGLRYRFVNDRTIAVFAAESKVSPVAYLIPPAAAAISPTAAKTLEDPPAVEAPPKVGLLHRLLFAQSGDPTRSTAPADASSAPVALEEITVTARKVEENIMTVPVSVSTLSAADINAADIKDMSEISLYEPSFRFVNQLGGQSPLTDRSVMAVTFRGLNEIQVASAPNGSGSVFIDGAPVIDGLAPDLDEIERVEVLKGPQSAYFGRSTFAGAINYVTKDPSLTTFKGIVSAESSSYNSTDDSIALEIPLIRDVLGIRVSGRHQIKGGEYTNAADTDQKLGEEGTDSASATILFKPNDRLKVKGWLSWLGEDDGPATNFGINESDGLFNAVSPAGATNQGGYIRGPLPNVGTLNPANISSDTTMTPFFQGIFVQNVDGFVLPYNPDFLDHFGLRRIALQGDVRVDFEFLPGYNLSSLTAYHFDKMEDHFDTDDRDGHNIPNPDAAVPGTLPFWAININEERQTSDWSQELRISSPQDQKLKWTIGGNYFHSYSPGYGLWAYFPFGAFEPGSLTPSSTDTTAGFGGVHYEFVPKLTLSLEARYQWDTLKEQSFYNGTVPTTGAAALPLSATFRSFSPRISLDYQYLPDSTAYVLFSRGYRPGGFNTTNVVDTPAQRAYIAAQGDNAGITYAQERLDNYEFGVKSTFWDGRARTSISFYYDKWINGQIGTSVSLPTYPGEPIGPSNPYLNQEPTGNAGLIDLKGIEYTGDLQATAHLLIGSSFAVNDTDVISYTPCGDCVAILGTTAAHGHIPDVPKYTATLAETYTDHLFGDWKGYERVDYIYSGSKYVDFTNTSWMQAAKLFNVHLGIRDDAVRVEAFVKNLTNNSAPLSAVDGGNAFTIFSASQNGYIYQLPDKRSVGIRADYRF